MKIKVFIEAIIKILSGLFLLLLLIFLPAGFLAYFNGWLLIILLFVPMFIVGIIMMLKSPELFKRRLDVKEKEQEQKQVVIYSGLMFIVGFITAGLDYRFAWSNIPKALILSFSIVFCFAIFYMQKY